MKIVYIAKMPQINAKHVNKVFPVIMENALLHVLIHFSQMESIVYNAAASAKHAKIRKMNALLALIHIIYITIAAFLIALG